jgi:hypothetical protein
MGRVSRARSRGSLIDLFYNPGQQKRLRSTRTGRGVLWYINGIGAWVWPAQAKRERQEVARAAGIVPPYRGVRRRGMVGRL